MAERYELFGASNCDATLPLNAIVEEQTFGQFVTLATLVDGAPTYVRLKDHSSASASDKRVGGITLEALMSTAKSGSLSPGARGDEGAHVALFLPWKQRWELLGYSRGLLLHSLSLAPQEETTIELFTWDRRKRTLEQESETETEEAYERADVTKDTTDVINELTSSNEFQAQADARIRVTYPVVNAEVGGQLSNKETIGRIAKRTAQHLAESTTKAATRVKTRRKTKITETMEIGREERVTRKVRNANMCHALNLDYFEVVANYGVSVSFAEEDAAVCVLIDMPDEIVAIDLRDPLTCRIHERALRQVLLDTNLAPGFDAARWLAARERAKALACDKVHCPANAPAAKPGAPEQGKVTPAPVLPEELRNALAELARIGRLLAGSGYQPLMTHLRDTHGASPSQDALVQFRSWLYWSLLARLIPGLADAVGDAGEAADVGSAVTSIVRAIPSPASMSQPGNLSEDPPHKADFDAIVWPVVNAYTDPFSRPWWWGVLRDVGALRPYDQGLAGALDQLQAASRRWEQSRLDNPVDSPATAEVRAAQELQQANMDNDRLEYAFPLKETADAQERLEALLGHLSRHTSYYRYAILQAMPLGDQMQLLASGDAPLELCEPRVIGMIQGARGAPDRVAVPLNMSLLQDAPDAPPARQALYALKGFVDEIIADLSRTEGGVRHLDLPTSGVTLETRLGRCDSCETFIGQSREIDLEQRREQARATRAATNLQELEAERYRARLDAAEPQLGDPAPQADGVRLRLDPVRMVVERPRS
jgi:hypothetical protein